MGSTTVAKARSGAQPCHATGNVSNFLWLLCIPMNGDGRLERNEGTRGQRGKCTGGWKGDGERERENRGGGPPIVLSDGFGGIVNTHGIIRGILITGNPTKHSYPPSFLARTLRPCW